MGRGREVVAIGVISSLVLTGCNGDSKPIELPTPTPTPKGEITLASRTPVTGLEKVTCPGDKFEHDVPINRDTKDVILIPQEDHAIIAVNNTNTGINEGTGVRWRLPYKEAKWHETNADGDRITNTVVQFNSPVQIDLKEGGWFRCKDSLKTAEAERVSRVNNLFDQPLLGTRLVQEVLVEGKDYYVREVQRGTDAQRLPSIKTDGVKHAA